MRAVHSGPEPRLEGVLGGARVTPWDAINDVEIRCASRCLCGLEKIWHVQFPGTARSWRDQTLFPPRPQK